MTVLFTTQNFLPDVGGIQAYMSGLADALAARGHRIAVFCDSTNANAESAFDRERNYRIDRYAGPRPWRRWRKARDSSGALSKGEVRAVVADTWKSLERIPARLLKKARVVCLAHGAELLSSPRGFKGRRIARALGKADLVAANSRFTAELVSPFVVAPSRVQVLLPGVQIPNGLAGTALPESNSLPRGPRLLTIARLDPYKGIDVVLGALPALTERYPGLVYDVVGSGQDRQRLLGLAEDLALQRSVRFHGSVSEDEKAALLRACDVFLLPSRIEPGEVEGFGIVLIEAGAFGKPAIAGRNGGTSDAVISGQTGFLVDGTNGSELVAAVTNLLDDPALAQRMGRAGQERFWAEFAWRAAIARFELAILGP